MIVHICPLVRKCEPICPLVSKCEPSSPTDTSHTLPKYVMCVCVCVRVRVRVRVYVCVICTKTHFIVVTVQVGEQSRYVCINKVTNLH